MKQYKFNENVLIVVENYPTAFPTGIFNFDRIKKCFVNEKMCYEIHMDGMIFIVHDKENKDFESMFPEFPYESKTNIAMNCDIFFVKNERYY